MSAIDDRIRQIFEFVKSRGNDGVKPEAMLTEIDQEARRGHPVLKVSGRVDAATAQLEFIFAGSDLWIVHDGTTWQLAGGGASQ